jgi:hypothetical protein
MSLDTLPSRASASPDNALTSRHWPLRGLLVALEAILALTALISAVIVVPSLPVVWLQRGPLTGYTIPALALGVICGGTALAALVAVIVKPRIGALLSIVAGAAIIAFELVEVVIVGLTAIASPGLPAAWLQEVYILLGLAIILLGARLWKAETGSWRGLLRLGW